MRSLSLICISFILCSQLIACAGIEPRQNASKASPVTTMALTKSAEEYLQLAAQATPPDQQRYQLYAARRLLQDAQLARATQILTTIHTEQAPLDIRAERAIVQAKVFLADHKPFQALAQLAPYKEQSLSQELQREFLDTSATAQADNAEISASISTRNQLNPLLNSAAQHQNQLVIWESVQHLPLADLAKLQAEPAPENNRGWFQLAQIAQQSLQKPQQLATDLAAWQQQYPDHPGMQVLPKQSSTRAVISSAPKKVFVLLPLQGKYGDSGQAIRNGFMAAFYANKSNKGTPPAIKVLDTSSQNIITLYNQAVAQGADLIVGPLDKDQVQALIKGTSLTVPTLALNSVTDQTVTNLYQFGLSQPDEAQQVATRAFNDGHRRALIIAPSGSWGEGIVNSFKKHWEAEGAIVAEQVTYQNSHQLAEQIRKALHVEKAQSRSADLKHVVNEESGSVVRRRQDIDAIFLVAEPSRAREIAPLLKFYYAGDIPVYATSLVYSGVKNPTQDNDLDNIQFADMPWVLDGLSTNHQAIQHNVAELWKTSYTRNPKLYALGVDAYELSLYLNQLSQFPQRGIRGATGTLYLHDDQHIYRELPWAQIRQGNPNILR
jgi:outer membrane PBP1 activator LpoA protein